MNTFCTSCGKPIAEGAGFCPACGARQPDRGSSANPVPPTTASAWRAPATPAPAKGSPVVKIVLVVVGIFALLTVLALGSCIFMAYRFRHKAQRFTAAMKAEAPGTTTGYKSASGMPYLPDSMDKLGDLVRKPTSSFHLSFKKVDSDGTSYSLEEEVTPSSMAGEETQVFPKTPTDAGGTKTFPRNASTGTNDGQMTATAIQLAYLNPMNIRDAQPSVKYGADEQTGGYDARRYDFDLSQLPASDRAGTVLASKWLGGVVNNATGGGHAVMKDYNVKGSLWLAKDDGRVVKFNYDYVTTFTDGSKHTTHYEGTVTRK